MATKKATKKPVLKAEKKTVLSVRYSDLNEFVEKVTGHSPDFVATQECGNDSDHEFTVSSEYNKYDREGYEKHCKGDTQYYSIGAILNCLCADGYIEAGTYLVSVCW